MRTISSESVKINPENGIFLDIGFGFVVNLTRVTCIVPFTGRVIARIYKERRDAGKFIDATKGRGKRSLILLDNGAVIGSAFKPETITSRQL